VSAERQQNRSAATQPSIQSNLQTDKKPSRATDPHKFALIVAGVGGEEAYTKKFTAQAMRLYEALTAQLGFAEKNVFLLTETAAGSPEDGAASKSATADEVRKAFASINSAANADSLVLVVLIGHGSFDNQQAKFNLIGPDLSAKEYAGLVAAVPTKKAVFINCASSSGEFIKPLSASGRIIITATRSGNEQNATNFAEHFIAGLTDPAADADKNGRVSLLEAFNYATKLTADWYKRKNRLATEHALIDDNGDGLGTPADWFRGVRAVKTAANSAGVDGLRAHQIHLVRSEQERKLSPAVRARRDELEVAIAKLREAKSKTTDEEYYGQLEPLLLELARLYGPSQSGFE
jgi:hypothetical protein